MNWIFLSLLAPFLFALGNHIDQDLVTKFFPGEEDSSSVGSLIIVSCIFGLLFLPFIVYFVPTVLQVPINDSLFLIGIGVVEGLAILAYLYAIFEGEEISSLVAWFNSIPVFSLILGFIFLGETISPVQFVGLCIVLGGLIMLSVRKEESTFLLKKKIVILMLTSSILYSAIYTFFKTVTETHSFWESAFWQYIGLTILGLIFFIFFKNYRTAFLQTFKNKSIKFYSLNLFNEIIFIGGNLITQFAMLLAPIALVSLLGAFQPLIVLSFTFVLSIFARSKEGLNNLPVWQTVTGILMTIAGLVFIF